jgi:hypothetical protein
VGSWAAWHLLIKDFPKAFTNNLLKVTHNPNPTNKTQMSSRLARKFATNKSAETLGILYEEVDNEGPLFHVRLARLGGDNKKYSERLGELMKPYRRMKIGDVPQKARDKAFLQTFCETVVIPGTWETWISSDGLESEERHQLDEQSAAPQFSGKWVPGIENPATGEILPATAANYYIVLDQLSELQNRLLTEATEFENYRLETLEIEAKN